MLFDLKKPIYAKDKNTEIKHLINGIYFPLGSASGKDITISVEDELSEWRSIEEVDLIQDE